MRPMKQNIILRAPIFSASGYGGHARDIALSLFDSMKFNVSVAPTQWGTSSSMDNIPVDDMEKILFMAQNRFDTNDFTFIHLGTAPEFQKLGKCSIGITAGLESDKLPKSWVEGCDRVDAVIVPSKFEKDLFIKSGVQTPIYVVEEGVNLDIYNPHVESRLNLPIDTEFNFLTSGHWMRGPIGSDRKQIGLMIRLFVETFQENKNVGLVVRTHTANSGSPDLHFTKDRIHQITGGRDYPRVYLVHGVMTDHEIAQLYTHLKIKAFTSVTSGEAWFRPLAEAVASDLPVLVTGWSGHMEYVHPDLATVYDHKLANIPPPAWNPNLLEQGMSWAVVNQDAVKRKLKRCIDRYGVAKERAQKLGETFRKNFSLEITSKKLVDVVSSVIQSSAAEKKEDDTIILDSGVSV